MSARHTERNPQNGLRLLNWYKNYDDLNPQQQILSCQKENIEWETGLRKAWITTIWYFVAVLAAIALIAGYAADISMRSLVAGPMLLMMPVIVLCMDEKRDNAATIASLARNPALRGTTHGNAHLATALTPAR